MPISKYPSHTGSRVQETEILLQKYLTYNLNDVTEQKNSRKHGTTKAECLEKLHKAPSIRITGHEIETIPPTQ